MKQTNGKQMSVAAITSEVVLHPELANKKVKFPDPVKTFENTLPENYPSWHYLVERVKECFNGDVKSIPATFVFNVMTDKREVYSYSFNMDFVKARCYEELDPILRQLEYSTQDKEKRQNPYEIIDLFMRMYERLFPF